MARRLALMAEGDHVSPWTSTTGDESAVRVEGLDSESKIGLEAILKTGEELALYFDKGVTPLKPFDPLSWARYRVRKIAGGVSSLTTVEVLLGGN